MDSTYKRQLIPACMWKDNIQGISLHISEQPRKLCQEDKILDPGS